MRSPGIVWDELTKDIFTEEKLIYVLGCSSCDYFGKMFKEKVLNDKGPGSLELTFLGNPEG